MADTTSSSSNGATASVAAGSGNDPMGVAEAGLTQTETALKSELEPKADPQVLKKTFKVGPKQERLIGLWLDLAVRNPGLAPGRDPVGLFTEYQNVERLKKIVQRLRGLSKTGETTVLIRLAELWKIVGDISGVAGHTPGNPEVADAVRQTQAALSHGPRKQKATKAPITPIPTGKKALHEAALAHAKAAEEPGATVSPVTPVTPAAPAPAGTVPASGAPTTNTNGGTPPSGHAS